MAALNTLIDKLPDGIETQIGENGVVLSDGEGQRLALAQSLLCKSEIILLDEVTANIDRESEREIRIALKKIMQSRNLAIISISHRIDFLQVVDRIIELDGGQAKRIQHMKNTLLNHHNDYIIEDLINYISMNISNYGKCMIRISVKYSYERKLYLRY